ncbi:hypothetical protein LEP1GSC021_1013 [Leptospira noguchii str. 1993005606]|nr:hypothetical protein LEP1GSC021_1013 [Leptospira noguchii str. 1993005606]
MKEILHSIFWKQIHNIMFMCPSDKTYQFLSTFHIKSLFDN